MSTQVVCAACGKGGDNLKVCTSCEQVSYCNAKCRKAHRSKHKKECRRLAAEKHNSETTISNFYVDAIKERFSKIEISDEELFAEPPPKEDCDTCFLFMPFDSSVCGVSTVYQICCGKTLCYGCVMASWEEMSKGKLKRCCLFCRVPLPSTDNERIERVKKRMKLNDAEAFCWLASEYYHGTKGLPLDYRKSFELYSRGAELGSIQAHNHLAAAYLIDQGVEMDEEKVEYHLMCAAIGGSEIARHMLGEAEVNRGNTDRAMKHYMIAARSGHDKALKEISEGYKAGHITKEEYASTLRAHKQSTKEMKIEQRDIAAAIDD